jgi:hypothetical protein
MRTVFSFLGFLLPATGAVAQLQTIIHQAFELDTTEVIQFELFGAYEAQPWSGNTVLTETIVQLHEASDGILKHFVEHGRFQIEAALEGEVIRLFSQDRERRPIKTKNGECLEIVKMRIFVPDNYQPEGEHRWRKEKNE